MDFYDVNLVDGYNVPMLVVPQGGLGANCTTTICASDLNGACPSDLRGDELRWRRCSRTWLLGRSSTAAAARTARPMPASRCRILRCSRAHVHVHTATPMMIKPEPSHVPALIISSHFARAKYEVNLL
ncbi:Pathogenesis-related thaumatin superfamily protein [Abeliophyllum distichum]|uniref:Pathogenesis-related thaumatin superfamily protein n=1 Tax=Abeliophyllum distichum TaxID=126358 RepID=A0ABD1QFN7_9LAMI